MTPTYEFMPGVPAMGHISAGGFWHSGSGDSCTKCHPPEPKRWQATRQVEVRVLPPCDLDPNHPPARYDGKTVYGPWGYMCEPCFARFGIGLGTGKGQRLRLRGEEVES